MSELKSVLIVVSPTLSVGRACWRGVNRFIRERQPHWVLSSHPAWRFADRHQPMALGIRVDGAILWQFEPLPDMSWWGPETRVVAVINRELEGTTPTVVADDQAKGREAAQHLLEKGITRFLYLGRPGKLSYLRQQGFAAAIREAGFAAPEVIDFDERESTGSFTRFLQSLVSERPPTLGVLTYNDSLGAFLLDCCRTAGIAVPKSIAVVGIDDDELICESCSPPLSSVRAPSERLGYGAASLLARMLSGELIPPTHVEILLGDCFVVARGSSTPSETSDPVVQNAMATIRARFQDNISVNDLYRRQNISRRAFEYRFRRAMGCGPYEMILRMRVEHAKALLLNTPGKLHMIAYQCGFNSETRFSENFRRLTGVTPGQYRARIPAQRRSARRRG